MKKIVILLISSTLFFITSCNAQNNDDLVFSMLKEFYTSYNLLWSKDIQPNDLIKQMNSLQQKYCTKRFQKELKKIFEVHGLDHDVLINDVYTEDIESLKTMSIIKYNTKENTYLVTYNAVVTGIDYKKINQKVQIYVVVVKEDGQYKIDNVLDIN
jgi:hypothetical protein